MGLKMRRYRDEEDYWSIRAFLREVFLANGRRELSWQPYRFDYWRWHGVANLGHGRLEEDVFLWETAEGEIAAVLNREMWGHAHLQVHPEYRTEALEEEMVEVAEEHLVIDSAELDMPQARGRALYVMVNAGDELRQGVVLKRGYAKEDGAEYQRWRSLAAPILEAAPPPGYQVRSLGDGAELLERCYASGLVFHDDDIQQAAENRAEVGWYRSIQNAPLYRRDLDLVAIAPDGSVASFCTVWFDDVTRTGAFEPVGTVPAYQRRGLAKAVLCEGLRRLKRMGATLAFVGSYITPAHALYASVGFTEYELSEQWAGVWL